MLPLIAICDLLHLRASISEPLTRLYNLSAEADPSPGMFVSGAPGFHNLF